MTVTLTPLAEQLVREQVSQGIARSPEEAVEQALVSIAPAKRRGGSLPEVHKTAVEAVTSILKLQERNTLGGLQIKDLIQEGRRF